MIKLNPDSMQIAAMPVDQLKQLDTDQLPVIAEALQNLDEDGHVIFRQNADTWRLYLVYLMGRLHSAEQRPQTPWFEFNFDLDDFINDVVGPAIRATAAVGVVGVVVFLFVQLIMSDYRQTAYDLYQQALANKCLMDEQKLIYCPNSPTRIDLPQNPVPYTVKEFLEMNSQERAWAEGQFQSAKSE